MKKLQFTVEIEFEDDVQPIHVKESADKILDALKHESESGNGLAADDAETFPTKITVSSDDIEHVNVNHKWF